jgi:hypothetical protein
VKRWEPRSASRPSSQTGQPRLRRPACGLSLTGSRRAPVRAVPPRCLLRADRRQRRSAGQARAATHLGSLGANHVETNRREVLLPSRGRVRRRKRTAPSKTADLLASDPRIYASMLKSACVLVRGYDESLQVCCMARWDAEERRQGESRVPTPHHPFGTRPGRGHPTSGASPCGLSQLRPSTGRRNPLALLPFAVERVRDPVDRATTALHVDRAATVARACPWRTRSRARAVGRPHCRCRLAEFHQGLRVFQLLVWHDIDRDVACVLSPTLGGRCGALRGHCKPEVGAKVFDSPDNRSTSHHVDLGAQHLQSTAIVPSATRPASLPRQRHRPGDRPRSSVQADADRKRSSRLPRPASVGARVASPGPMWFSAARAATPPAGRDRH